jgi:hypothetical protein
MRPHVSGAHRPGLPRDARPTRRCSLAWRAPRQRLHQYRAVTLTEAGLDYLARIEPILAALEEADHAARGTGELRGLLRVAASATFAAREVIPRLPGFTRLYPALRIEFVLSDQRQDLVNEAVDVALRIGVLNDSNAVARRIGVTHRILAASPTYLERAGTPKIPSDLSTHAVIVGPAAAGMKGWTFHKDGKATSVRVEGQIISNGSEGSRGSCCRPGNRFDRAFELSRGDHQRFFGACAARLGDGQCGRERRFARWPRRQTFGSGLHRLSGQGTARSLAPDGIAKRDTAHRSTLRPAMAYS